MTFRSFDKIDPHTKNDEGVIVINSKYIHEVYKFEGNIYALHTTKGEVYIRWGGGIYDLLNYLNGDY